MEYGVDDVSLEEEFVRLLEALGRGLHGILIVDVVLILLVELGNKILQMDCCSLFQGRDILCVQLREVFTHNF